MRRLIVVVVLALLAGFVVWPQSPGNYIPGGDALPGNPGIHLGSLQRQGARLGLEFKEQDASGNWIPATGTLNGQPVALTGSFLIPGRQQVTFQGQGGLPQVAFSFNSDGAQLFQQITTRLIQ